MTANLSKGSPHLGPFLYRTLQWKARIAGAILLAAGSRRERRCHWQNNMAKTKANYAGPKVDPLLQGAACLAHVHGHSRAKRLMRGTLRHQRKNREHALQRQAEREREEQENEALLDAYMALLWRGE